MTPCGGFGREIKLSGTFPKRDRVRRVLVSFLSCIRAMFFTSREVLGRKGATSLHRSSRSFGDKGLHLEVHAKTVNPVDQIFELFNILLHRQGLMNARKLALMTRLETFQIKSTNNNGAKFQP